MDFSSLISRNEVFTSLDSKKLIAFQKLSITKKLQRGEFLTYQDDIWPYLILIKSGEFQALKESGQGRSFVIKSFFPGDIFWGLAVFENDKPNPMSIRAAADGEVYLWDKSQIKSLVSSDPQVAWELFSLLARTMERAGEIVEELAFRPLTGRLASLLLELNADNLDGFVARDLTLDEMAARIGTTREMVCKILYRFSDQGIIDIHRTEIRINKRDELKSSSKMIK